jgi:hypothetical protein
VGKNKEEKKQEEKRRSEYIVKLIKSSFENNTIIL